MTITDIEFLLERMPLGLKHFECENTLFSAEEVESLSAYLCRNQGLESLVVSFDEGILEERDFYEMFIGSLMFANNLKKLDISALSSDLFYSFVGMSRVTELTLRVLDDTFSVDQLTYSLKSNTALEKLRVVPHIQLQADILVPETVPHQLAREHPKLEQIVFEIGTDIPLSCDDFIVNYRLRNVLLNNQVSPPLVHVETAYRQNEIENMMSELLMVFRCISSFRFDRTGALPMEVIHHIVYRYFQERDLWYSDELRIVFRCLTVRWTLGRVRLPRRPFSLLYKYGDESKPEDEPLNYWYVDKELFCACKEALKECGLAA